MPATQFICPDGQHIPILQCLTACPKQTRCMFLPTLRAIAKSVNRPIAEPTVTELIAGVRETYLKKTMPYAVSPQRILYALQGQAVHTIHERCTQGEILSEIRLKDQITSGQFDLYGRILDTEEGVLGDLKVTSSYKLMKALGIYKQKVPTGELYKTGSRKGQLKYKTILCYDGVRHVWDWAVQLNYYRMLLEQAGFPVHRMYIQALCRDSGLRLLPNGELTNHCISFRFIKSATDGSNGISAAKQHYCSRQKMPILFRRSVPPENDGRIENAWITVTAENTAPMAESFSSLEKPGNNVQQKFSQSKTKGE